MWQNRTEDRTRKTQNGTKKQIDGLDVEGHLRAIEAQLASLGIDQRLFGAVLAQYDLGY